MWSFAFVFAALLSVPAAHCLDVQSAVPKLAAAEPGFTWCYEPHLRIPCVNASTPPGKCINVRGTDNDKASSAKGNAKSLCTLYKHKNCIGETLDIAPLQTINKFSDYNFDNLMSAYRCQWMTPASPPTEVSCNILVTDTASGNDFGYISIPTNTYGFYGELQPTQAGALAVSFSYSESTNRLNLRAMNGPTAESSFPFVGGVFNYLPQYSMGPGHERHAELIGTSETPSGKPQVDSPLNSVSAVDGGNLLPIESPIWRYDPATRGLAAQWINPDSSEPQTFIVRGWWGGLVLSGDVEAFRRVYGGTESNEVTFKCVPT
ncbi:hypothetical protein DFH09DRAFT_1168545 [Mycena vulgaris]|nr:hypothetical protein DFH09DRAFT_1168545 [Mycena vulgaris]